MGYSHFWKKIRNPSNNKTGGEPSSESSPANLNTAPEIIQSIRFSFFTPPFPSFFLGLPKNSSTTYMMRMTAKMPTIPCPISRNDKKNVSFIGRPPLEKSWDQTQNDATCDD